MIDDTQQTDNVQSPDNIEELHEEDAELDIDFESAAKPSDLSVGSDAPEVDPSESAGEGEATASSELVATLEQRISALRAQLEDRTNQSMRMAADFENFRKRTGKEKEDLEEQIKGNTVIDLLPVVDNFERARSQIKPQTEAEMTIHKSYQSVYKQLVECLKRLGVSAMRAEGQQFDPNLHEAVMREPTVQHEDGEVMEEFVRGYMLGDRVLRHAMVKVAAPPEDAPADNPGLDSADSPEDGAAD
jgi:molecular chaperone GrpE